MEALRRAAFIVLLRFVSDDYPLLRLEVIWIIISRIALIRVVIYVCLGGKFWNSRIKAENFHANIMIF